MVTAAHGKLNLREINSALPAYWVGIGYLTDGRESGVMKGNSFTGRKATAETAVSRLFCKSEISPYELVHFSASTKLSAAWLYQIGYAPAVAADRGIRTLGGSGDGSTVDDTVLSGTNTRGAGMPQGSIRLRLLEVATGDEGEVEESEVKVEAWPLL
ncbi:hypothetical protein EVAR_31383_1 [Eumeta japonica]|uniref:Uncharacterized protein n=1 Tax=Eumeta variegata TaxID=151549 RepID=A0A4C1XAZ5_EUMVA|nr:hypothetical protein EVAR_31383_1 [Eumeta japonica]